MKLRGISNDGMKRLNALHKQALDPGTYDSEEGLTFDEQIDLLYEVIRKLNGASQMVHSEFEGMQADEFPFAEVVGGSEVVSYFDDYADMIDELAAALQLEANALETAARG